MNKITTITAAALLDADSRFNVTLALATRNVLVLETAEVEDGVAVKHRHYTVNDKRSFKAVVETTTFARDAEITVVGYDGRFDVVDDDGKEEWIVNPMFVNGADYIEVLEPRRSAFERKLATLTKKAALVGVPAPVLKSHGKYIEAVDVGERNSVAMEFEVERFSLVVSETVKLGDWKFAATIDHAGANNIIRRVPGLDESIEIPTEFRTTDARRCDHCNSKRRRKDTYIVFNADGEWKQIGSNCLALYFGIDPKNALGFYRYYSSFANGAVDPETDEMLTKVTPVYPMIDIVAIAAAVIEQHGWVPKSSYDGEPTSNVVSAFLYERSDAKREAILPDGVTDAHRARAAEAIEWAKSNGDSKNDYIYNLFALASNEYIDDRSFGLAVSLPRAYNRNKEFTLERERKDKLKADAKRLDAESTYFGEPKTRYTDLGNAEVIMHRELPGYGYNSPATHLYKFRAEDGTLFTWFSSKDKDIDTGDTVSLDAATVKKHDEYQGTKSTVITRVNLTKLEKADMK